MRAVKTELGYESNIGPLADLEELSGRAEIIEYLRLGKKLPPNSHDHPLTGGKLRGY